MGIEKDSRWEQRLSNYNKALKKLTVAVTEIRKYQEARYKDGSVKAEEDAVGEMMREGVIQRFEYTHELAWNVMKDFLSETGDINLYGSRDTSREAFRTGLISNGDVWMEMIKSRNQTTHTYNEETARDIFDRILNSYYSAFLDFQKTMIDKAK